MKKGKPIKKSTPGTNGKEDKDKKIKNFAKPDHILRNKEVGPKCKEDSKQPCRKKKDPGQRRG